MKLNRFTFCVLILVGMTVPVLAQKLFQGKVLEVSDGKSIVVETPEKNKFALQLQFIEVPGSEYPISKTVKDHLQKMLLGKTVDFQVKSTAGNKNICLVMLNKIDLSQQLIRDGAGWYDYSGELKPGGIENSEYVKMENAAKSEMRGVWSDATIKPSWQIKAERDAEEQRLAQIADDEKAAAAFEKKRIARENANSRVQIWSDIPDSLTGSSGFKTTYDKFTNVTQIYTALMPLSLTKKHDHFSMSFDIAHAFTGQDVTKGTGHYYILTFVGRGIIVFLEYGNDLRLIYGENRMRLESVDSSFDKSRDINPQTEATDDIKTLRFRMSEQQFKQLTSSVQQVEFRVGAYEGVFSSSQINSIKNMP